MHELRVPLLNANEDELRVVGIFVEEGQRVSAGELICSLESTKTSTDLEAEVSGFVRGLGLREGARIRVGARICWIAESADAPLPEGAVAAAGSEVKATRRASQLAAEHGLELSAIATSGILREKDVLRHLEASGGIHPLDAEERFAAGLDPGGRRPVLIHGAGQHARVVVELCAQACPELVIVGALDDRAAPGVEILGVPLIGRMSALDSLREAGVDQLLMGVGAIVQNSLRVGNYQRAIEAGFEVPALIHPRACVEPSARVGAGAQILANATVGGSVVIHEDVIVNSGAVVSHDCVIGAHSHITPGALLAGGVTIGDDSVVGMGATVYLGVRIGAGVRIGNGAHVFRDLPDGTLVRPGELV